MRTTTSRTNAIAYALLACLVQLPHTIMALTLQQQRHQNDVSDTTHTAYSVKNRRRIVLGSFLSASFTMKLISPPSAIAATMKSSSLDSTMIDQDESTNNRTLGVERMADAINDGIKETGWPVTGNGRPQLFSNNFIFTDATMKQNIRGYEAYCRFVRQQYSHHDAKFELICCSVTGPYAISALWRVTEIPPESSKLVQSEFTTNPEDGLVVRQVDTVIQTGDIPSWEMLQMRCNWYTCNLRS